MVLFILLCMTTAYGLDVSIFNGVNPYDWEDTTRIIYNYKGFFNSMIEQVKEDIFNTWEEDEVTINVETNDVAGSASRVIPSGEVLSKTLEMKANSNLDGIIGVSDSGEGFFAGEMAEVLNIHTHADNKLKLLELSGDKKSSMFPHTIRMGPTLSYVSNVILDVVNWIDAGKSSEKAANIMIFHENTFGSEKIAATLKTTLKSHNSKWTATLAAFHSSDFDGAGTFDSILFDDTKVNSDFFESNCQAALTQARGIVIIGVPGFIRHTSIMLYKAAEASDNVDFYDFFLIGVPATLWPKPSFKAKDTMQLNSRLFSENNDDIAKLAFQNMFVITENINETRFDEISDAVKASFGDWTPNRQVPLWSGYFYDGLLLMMKAAKEESKPSKYYSYLVGKKWAASDLDGIEPVSGEIEINANGDRVCHIEISHYKAAGVWETVAQHSSTTSGFKPKKSIGAVAWPRNLPLMYPKCGYSGCMGLSDANKQLIEILIYIVIVLVITVLLAIFCIKRQREEKELMDMGWRVDFNALTIAEQDDNDLDFELSESSGSIQSAADNLKVGGIMKSESLESLDLAMGQKLMHQNVAVFIKPLLRDFFQTAQNRKLMKELKSLRDLADDYLVSVIGLTRDDMNYCWLVQEQCQKGTLKEVLENDNMELESNFKVNMIDDIAKGMAFIHNKTNLGSHGNLKTSNILISNNFTMKISDFGESVFLSDMKKIHHHTEIERNKRLLWRAPELLRKKRVNINGTKAGDVYSFAVIAHEIITALGPFNLRCPENTDTATTIILKLQDTSLEAPFRPDFPEVIRHKPLRKIAERVKNSWWSADESQRETFKKICERIKAVKPGSSNTGTSFLDIAVRRMEKFSSTQEKRAEEKEAQAAAEEKKVQELKEHFVPKSIIHHGLAEYKPEKLDDTTVAVIELAGMELALKSNTPDEIVAVETAFRGRLDKISSKAAFFFGQPDHLHRVYVTSRSNSQQPAHHHSTVKVVQQIMRKMEKEIEEMKLREAGISVKAGMHTGTIYAGLIGNNENSVPRFNYFGAEEADHLCSAAEAFEILVSSEAHRVIQQITEKDVVLDFGAKRQYQTGKTLEAYCLKY